MIKNVNHKFLRNNAAFVGKCNLGFIYHQKKWFHTNIMMYNYVVPWWTFFRICIMYHNFVGSTNVPHAKCSIMIAQNDMENVYITKCQETMMVLLGNVTYMLQYSLEEMVQHKSYAKRIMGHLDEWGNVNLCISKCSQRNGSTQTL